MSTSTTLLARIAPQFAADTAGMELFLEMAALVHDVDAWGAAYPLGMAYYAAHMMTLSPLTAAAAAAAAGVAGPVTSRTAGGTSESYANADGMSSRTIDEAALSTTAYGRMYLALRSTRAARLPTLIDVNAT